MEIDALTIDLVPVGGKATTNLLMGGDFELGDPEPYGWDRRSRSPAIAPGPGVGLGAGALDLGARGR